MELVCCTTALKRHTGARRTERMRATLKCTSEDAEKEREACARKIKVDPIVSANLRKQPALVRTSRNSARKHAPKLHKEKKKQAPNPKRTRKPDRNIPETVRRPHQKSPELRATTKAVQEPTTQTALKPLTSSCWNIH